MKVLWGILGVWLFLVFLSIFLKWAVFRYMLPIMFIVFVFYLGFWTIAALRSRNSDQ